MQETNVICVTSVRNDSWILKGFLETTIKWADLVIIGDHNSVDGGIDIIRHYDRVKLIHHQSSSGFLQRRRDLINEARKVPGKRLIFCLDSDELISANWADSIEWDLMLNAKPGTGFAFDWVHLLPGLENGTIFWMPAAFVDDDTAYPPGENIHGSAIRFPEITGEIVMLKDIKLLHCIAIAPARMLSKHRYYKCYEYLEFGKRPWQVNVFYQDTKINFYNLPQVPIKEEWLAGYDWLDEYRFINENEEKCYWYDGEVLNYFDTLGIDKFRKLNIWDVDWNKKAQLLGRNEVYRDPRSRYEIWVHKYIENHRTELKLSKSFQYKFVRLFAKTVLRALGW